MRSIVVLPFVLIAIAAGCSSGAREQTAQSLPRRDLTLASRSPELQMVSALESGKPQVHHKAARQPKVRLATALPAPAPTPAPAAPVVPVAVPQPVETPEAPLNDRELLPGKTITIIPVSTGSSPGPEDTEAVPAERGRPMVTGGGGTCRGRGRGRGPGIGIAGVPRPDFR